jgi:hypothetical protein
MAWLALVPMQNQASPTTLPSDAADPAAFQFNMPMLPFEKADGEDGPKKRIAGIVSTDSVDQQNERLLQEGLDFGPFLDKGWYNDNHLGDTGSVVGYPKSVTAYSKGDTLPNGDTAKSTLTWSEGFLVGKKGDDIWELAKDLQGTGRHLGFSVEGVIEKRKSDDNNVVAAAIIKNVAITSCPVNEETHLDVLMRSMAAINKQEAMKAFTMGDTPTQSTANPLPQPTPNAPATGEGAGKVLSAQFPPLGLKTKKKKLKSKSTNKSLSAAEALQWVQKNVPGVSSKTAQQFLKTAQRLMAKGLT